jgi:hypothetical protein
MYAHKIYISHFDHEFCSKITSLASILLDAHLNTSNFKLPTYNGTNHTNILFYSDAIKELPELSFIMEDCNLTILSVPTMGFVPPNKVMGVHTDKYGCIAKILLPIWPIQNSHPLNFYDEPNGDPIFSINTDSGHPIVFDCNKLHGGINTYDNWRTNLQFKFAEPFDVVVEMIKDNTLFKTIETKLLD